MTSGNLPISNNPGRDDRSFAEPDLGIYTIGSGTAEDVLRDLLARGVTVPAVEVLIQYPASDNSLLELSALALDGITSFTLTRNEDPTADTLDLAIANGDGRYTPTL